MLIACSMTGESWRPRHSGFHRFAVRAHSDQQEDGELPRYVPTVPMELNSDFKCEAQELPIDRRIMASGDLVTRGSIDARPSD